MTIMQRTRVLWTGFPGGPGYTNLFSRVSSIGTHDPTLAMDDVATLFSGLATRIPSSVTLNIDPEVAYIEDTTGVAEGFDQVASVPSITQPSASGAYAAPTGASIEWSTDAVKNGRRVTGRTYLVPLVGAAFEPDGTLVAAALDQLSSAASVYALNSVANQVVWSRPSGSSAGSSHSISGARVADKAAVLRSRRD